MCFIHKEKILLVFTVVTVHFFKQVMFEKNPAFHLAEFNPMMYLNNSDCGSTGYRKLFILSFRAIS